MDNSVFFKAKRDWKLGIYSLLVFICLLFLTFYKLGINNKPESWGYSFFSLFQNVFFDVKSFSEETVLSIRELRDLQDEYHQLLLKMDQYQGLTDRIEQLEMENEQLKSQLTFQQKLRYDNIPAEIIAKDPENIFGTIVVNKGFQHGVELNNPVVAFQEGNAGLVGKITEIGPYTSIVTPILAPGCYVASRFQRNRYEGLLHGSINDEGSLIMRHVNKSAIKEISVNDLIITSGLSSIYPKNIAVGRVLTIKSKEYDTSLEIIAEPVINFSKLEYLIILNLQNTEQQ